MSLAEWWNIEVPVVFHDESDAGDACGHERTDVDPAPSPDDSARPQLREQRSPTRQPEHGRRIGFHGEAAGRKRAAVGLDRGHVSFDRPCLRLHVRSSAPQAVLLVHEHHGPDGSLRLEPDALEEIQRLDRLHAAPAVVVSAMPLVPRIEVSAHNHDLVRLLRADEFTQDVPRRRIRERAGRETHPEADHAFGLQQLAE